MLFLPTAPSCIRFPLFYLNYCTETVFFIPPLLNRERKKSRAFVATHKVKNCNYHHLSCGDQPQSSMGEWSRKPADSSWPVPSCWDKRHPVPRCCLPDPHSPRLMFMSLPPVSHAGRGATAPCWPSPRWPLITSLCYTLHHRPLKSRLPRSAPSLHPQTHVYLQT